MPHTTFNVDEVSEYLHLPRAEVEELVRRGEVPFERAGERAVFRRADIDAWASQRILGFSGSHLKDYHRRSTAKAHDLSRERAIVAELLRPDGVRPGLASKTKPSLIRDLVQMAVATGLVVYPDDLLRSIEKRERLCSTALTGGVAMLHPGHHEPYMFEDSFLLLARTAQPIPFGSPDGQTSDLFFLMCCQDDRLHLHVLARLCMICFHTDALLRLREAPDAEAMWRAVEAAEADVLKIT